MCSKRAEVESDTLTYSLWDQAQGKTPFDCSDDWPRRCDSCGRRVGFGEFVSVLIGKTDRTIVVHEICRQHGGRHWDCLKGVNVNFGDGKSWPAIWASNLLSELAFWLKSIVRFAWLILARLLFVVMHPLRYRRYRQRMREWGID